MSLLNRDFEGLLPEDFDAYLPEKWSNNLHNLERMKVKEKLLTLIKHVHGELDLPALKVEASSEIPSVWNGRKVEDQWVYLLRDEASRRQLQPVLARRTELETRVKVPAEHYRHALVCIRIDHEVLEVGLRISQYATVDLANFSGRANSEGDGLETMLKSLPDTVGLEGNAGQRDELLSAIAAARSGERTWFLLCRNFDRAEAIELGAQITEAIQDVARGVVPLFNYLLWRPENDFVDVASELSNIAEEQAERQRSRVEAREEKVKAHAERAEKARARTASKVNVEEAWRRMQQERVRTSKPPAPAAPARKPHRNEGNTRRNEGDTRRNEGDTRRKEGANRQRSGKPQRERQRPREQPRTGASAQQVTYEVGEKCRFRRGLLAGKEGVVTAEAKPGQYTVKSGLFEVDVKAYELEKLS